MNKNRGMMLESIINKTISIYDREKIGLFHKKVVPITFSGLKKEGQKLKVKEGWIANKSTTDYYGIYKGVFVAFEAKSTNLKSLPLTNIKEHQMKYINKIKEYGGVGFYIFYFKTYDEFYLITQDILLSTSNKSFSIDIARKKGYRLDLIYPGMIDFAPIIDELI